VNQHAVRAQAFLRGVTYKPGVTFSVEPANEPGPPGFYGGFILRISGRVVDSTIAAGGLTIGLSTTLAGHSAERVLQSRQSFFAWLRQTLLFELEAHERDEWLKLDGKVLIDPHAPGWRA
jgi:hypothetical protein